MAGVSGASPAPVLVPVGARGRGSSGWVALGLMVLALMALVGISVLDQSGGGSPLGSQPAAGGPIATSSPTAPSEPSSGPTPPPGAVFLGPVRACPAGSAPDTPGLVAQERPPLGFISPMAFDRRGNRILLLATADGPEDPETWAFDVCSNTWTRMQPAREPDNGWSQLVFDVDSDVAIMVDRASWRVWVYDITASTWTVKGAAPAGPTNRAMVYDPVSGRIVAEAFATSGESVGAAFSAYEAENDAWIRIRQASGPAPGSWRGDGLLSYDASVDRIIAYVRNPSVTGRVDTWRFDLRTGAWSQSAAVTPWVNWGYGPPGGEIAYDEANQRTVIFSDAQVIAYDARTDRWEALVEAPAPGDLRFGPTARLLHTMVYDPVNQRFVVYGGMYRTSSGFGDVSWVRADDVLAFDPVTRAWTTLLEARTILPPVP